MEFLSKHGWSLFLLIAGIAVLIATFINTVQDTNQKEKLEKLVVGVKELAENDSIVTKKLERLTVANGQISKENLTISEETKKLAIHVKQLTKQINTLTEKINERTSREAAENLKTGELIFDVNVDRRSPITLWAGSNKYESDIEAVEKYGVRFISVDGVQQIEVKVIENRLALSVNTFDVNGNWIGSVQDNFWRRNPNYFSKLNYDDKGIEIIDNQNRIVLSIDIRPNNEIHVQGIFPDFTARNITFIGVKQYRAAKLMDQEDIVKLSKMGVTVKSIINEAVFEPIFEYYGPNWLHKRKAK